MTQIPDGVDFAAVIKNAMDVYNVEISGGLGPSIGKVWRVGIMVRSWLIAVAAVYGTQPCAVGVPSADFNYYCRGTMHVLPTLPLCWRHSEMG